MNRELTPQMAIIVILIVATVCALVAWAITSKKKQGVPPRQWPAPWFSSSVMQMGPTADAWRLGTLTKEQVR